jgi:ribonucleoside-triphosphate reductase
MELHDLLRSLFEKRCGESLSSRDIVDIMNFIGKCVIAGNIRRVAEIAIGGAYDKEFIQLKDYNANPDRAEYGWVSNNSIFAELGMDYE